MALASKIVEYSLDHPKRITLIMIIVTLALGAMIPWVKVDTDPENMLSEHEAVRVFHHEMKREFVLNDMVVLGIVNEKDPDGVFNPASLARVYELTKFAEKLRWPDPKNPGREIGVVEVDLLAPSKVDNIEPMPGQPGTVRFEWLMPEPPTTREAARAIREKAKANPLLDGTLVSEDGKALCLYLPLTSKDLSYRVYAKLQERMPIIWLWGLMSHQVRLVAVRDEARPAVEALLELGRLHALRAVDREHFLSGVAALTRVPRHALAGPAGWGQVAETARRLAAEAAAPGRDVSPHKPSASLAAKLAVALQDTQNSLFVDAILYADSQAMGQLSLSQQLEAVAAFATRMAAAFQRANTAELNALMGVLAEVAGQVPEFPGDDHYHITGLPVAEDTFGVEMFKQMAISAPLAMLVIFILMFAFFRKLTLILSPMILAMVSVIMTMGLLIGTGHTVHIMSSMIPIFIMPISVLDSVHIISQFFDHYQRTRDRRKTMVAVMHELFMPMLYTSLTTVAGFASLALTPIPPVQVFGVFVAIGVALAWVFTVTFVPAFVMFIPERRLANFGTMHHDDAPKSLLARVLHGLGGFAYHRAKLILGITLLLAAVAGYGISRININDNPVKWFTPSHPIRVADKVLNEHFGGTYMAYLVLEPESTARKADDVAKALDARLVKAAKGLKQDFPEAAPTIEKGRTLIAELAKEAQTGDALLDEAARRVAELKAKVSGDEADAWTEVAGAIGAEQLAKQVFKNPEVLRYIEGLQRALLTTGVVGKSNSVADVVRKVHKELMEGKPEFYRIPDTSDAVAQCLLSFQNSHDPDDLWHLVTPDYGKANLWVQLKSGDNRDMERVVRFVDTFLRDHTPPVKLQHRWFGLTYINVVWQDKMVSGMLSSFLGSFAMVFVMMVVLYRSALWGLLAMIPLTITIGLIYGIIGLIGKDYDMPTAVLSSLTLGLAVDFAIHFLSRSRELVAELGTWKEVAAKMFGEPARAIARNIIVIAIGFTPLLAAPLMPYKTVGFFMASILAIAGIATLFVLTALVTVLAGRLFRLKAPQAAACNCGVCIAASAGTVVVIALSINNYITWHWTTLTWVGAVAIVALTALCGIMSRRQACRRAEGGKGE